MNPSDRLIANMIRADIELNKILEMKVSDLAVKCYGPMSQSTEMQARAEIVQKKLHDFIKGLGETYGVILPSLLACTFEGYVNWRNSLDGQSDHVIIQPFQ